MRLKELRKEVGKTQKEIAEFLNVSQASYQNYEVGITEPSLESLCKLADYYQVSLDSIVGRQFNDDLGYIEKKDKSNIKLFLTLNDQNKLKASAFMAGLLATQN